jgi:hypothetical protein
VHSTRKTSSLPPHPDTLGVRTYGHCRETSDRDWDLVAGARHGGPYLESLHFRLGDALPRHFSTSWSAAAPGFAIWSVVE